MSTRQIYSNKDISSLHISFESWTQKRAVSTLGSNVGSEKLPFQTWHHFKEAYTPELVAKAVVGSKRDLLRCVDPFGGSGTTALTCQFLGIEPVTIEVNPYLADLIEAKLCVYDSDNLARSLGRIVRFMHSAKASCKRLAGLPSTFIESENKDRWIFDRPIANRIAACLDAIDGLSNPVHRRFFRMQLGGMLIHISNVVVNGKGRRYRQGWSTRFISVEEFDKIFCERSQKAIVEVHAHRFRKEKNYTLIRGDSRQAVAAIGEIDGAIFSPPYPNSFDYTDVYNVELWVLGYLSSAHGNRALRESTLCSHVQVRREFPSAPAESNQLTMALKRLTSVRGDLWNPWIPEMVGGYFYDIKLIFEGLHAQLASEGEVWAVVGDSQYAGILIPTATILAELAPTMGYAVVNIESFRSMRASAQQGGQEKLDEALIVLRKK
ncbi:hypothetical protein [Solidesulfovibrio sp.]|uniref:hypothetical protein n=1 Tax=Solidesulfovibrio sp. TaxID=2910990 RepID=UPI00261D1F71|nr:hypothetical protein [Solidesulfovibrio sp.]